MSPQAKKLGEVVRELRERQGLTQAQLAERAQLAMSYITLLEAGQHANLSPSALGASPGHSASPPSTSPRWEARPPGFKPGR